MRLPLYFDYMATTPVDPLVAKAMQACLDHEANFGNPASNTHEFGQRAAKLVANAREQIAKLINADVKEIVFTSGATESDNLAIIGAARFYYRNGKHIITMKTEHRAVLDACDYMAHQGWQISYLDPQPDGRLDLTQLENALRDDTVLVSIMQVNNETGVVQDIAAIAKIVKAHGALLHVDAAQSAGKMPIDLQTLPVDLMSFSAHKIYGPKGIGALYVRRKPRVRLEPLIYGGGHEYGLRSGTLATHQIVGMGEAFHLAQQNLATEPMRVKAMRDKLWDGIKSLNNVQLNGALKQRVCGCLNISVNHMDGESLLLGLKDLAVSSGSACNSATIEPSHVLIAMGLPRDLAEATIRLSVGRFTTDAQIDFAIDYINKQLSV